MAVKVVDQAFDPWRELQRFQDENSELLGKFGATAVFVGTMRDFNEDESVRTMTLEHYPGMTERHLAEICAAATKRWELLESLVVHRVGDLEPGEPIVLVAVWSAHRAAAFEASRHIMEDLKSRAPFWKKEQLDVGHRWVTKNTAGFTQKE
ncbi:MAG: molybdopterin synthase catalytic subunit [Gammaproteobacteria bacterium]|jgi:molybdopterin synthase catalytic subunit